jgi:hypothetical protein
MTDPIHLVAKTGEGVLLIETDKHGTGGVFLYHHENDGSERLTKPKSRPSFSLV